MKFSYIALTGIFGTALSANTCPAPGDKAAQVISNLNDIKTAVENTHVPVRAFDKSRGINAALSIQYLEQNVEKAVTAAIDSTQSSPKINQCDAQAITEAFKNLTPSVTALLADLGNKQSDFNSVGAISILSADLSTLQRGSHQLQTQLFNKFECSDVKNIQPYFDQTNEAFVSALKKIGGVSESAPTSSCKQM